MHLYGAAPYIAQSLKEEGIDSEIVFVGRDAVNGNINELVKSLKEKCAEADGFVFGSPVYPDSSFADLYDPLTMPSELRKAHAANDRAVMAAYGFSTKMSEADCVAKLMEMYQNLVEKQK